MITFQFSDFLNANAQEYARLIASAYPFGALGANPTGKFISEQYKNVASIGNPSGAVYYQPGIPSFSSGGAQTIEDDRCFVGSCYIKLYVEEEVPTSFDFSVIAYGVSMGPNYAQDPTGETPFVTEMELWTSSNVQNALVFGQVVIIELPRMPFQYLAFENAGVSAAFDLSISWAFTGLEIKKA